MTDKEIQELKDYVDRCNKELRDYIDRQHKHMVDCLRKGIDAALLDQTYAAAKKELDISFKVNHPVPLERLKCNRCGKPVDWVKMDPGAGLTDLCWNCYNGKDPTNRG